jgi:hypothetical protein
MRLVAPVPCAVYVDGSPVDCDEAGGFEVPDDEQTHHIAFIG